MSNQVRIIAGQWRGRKLKFPDVPGLRPTPDRVRETLFNWLQFDIIGARCLDLFAGSGALGLEAASRGAARVVQVEVNPIACRCIGDHIGTLGAESQVAVVRSDVERFLEGPAQPFDLVFLDPPFGAGLVPPVCSALERHGWLSENAKIYIETEARNRDTDLPANWVAEKTKRAGEVAYRLYRRQPVEAARSI